MPTEDSLSSDYGVARHPMPRASTSVAGWSMGRDGPGMYSQANEGLQGGGWGFESPRLHQPVRALCHFGIGPAEGA
jgi:hypothetical protein